jgi:hypothetical protein
MSPMGQDAQAIMGVMKELGGQERALLEDDLPALSALAERCLKVDGGLPDAAPRPSSAGSTCPERVSACAAGRVADRCGGGGCAGR